MTPGQNRRSRVRHSSHLHLRCSTACWACAPVRLRRCAACMLRMSPLRGDRTVATPASPGRCAMRNQARPRSHAQACSGDCCSRALPATPGKRCRPCTLPEIYGDICRDNNCGPQALEIEPSDLGRRAHRHWSDHPRQARADDGTGSEDEKYRGAEVIEPQTTGAVAEQASARADEG